MSSLILETNILIDVWLEYGEGGPAMREMFEQAESEEFDVVIPSFVLSEFRGAALRRIRDARSNVQSVHESIGEWNEMSTIAEHAEQIQEDIDAVEDKLSHRRDEVDDVIGEWRELAVVYEKNAADIEHAGYRRWLEGRPPGGPREELRDCIIFESVLDWARNAEAPSPKMFLTRDSDFTSYRDELETDLKACDVELRTDTMSVYGDLLH